MAKKLCCGFKVPELKGGKRVRRLAAPPFRWNKRVLTWAMGARLLHGLNQTEQERIFVESYRLWAAASGLIFTPIIEPVVLTDITISFKPLPSDMLGQAVGPVGDDRPAYLHLNSAIAWTPGLLAAVHAHETGHNLGLRHSANPKSLMYEYVSEAIKTPQPEDIERVGALYGMPPPKHEIVLRFTKPVPRHRVVRQGDKRPARNWIRLDFEAPPPPASIK
jgi:hypothetical protein